LGKKVLEHIFNSYPNHRSDRNTKKNLDQRDVPKIIEKPDIIKHIVRNTDNMQEDVKIIEERVMELLNDDDIVPSLHIRIRKDK
jgi:hypothetical protein